MERVPLNTWTPVIQNELTAMTSICLQDVRKFLDKPIPRDLNGTYGDNELNLE